jgi:putative transposase
VGYRRPRHRGGESHIVVPNRLQRQFNPTAPDEAWVTDITHIRTHEGWLYLAVVVDLFSRKVIGWSMRCKWLSFITSILWWISFSSPSSLIIFFSFS